MMGLLKKKKNKLKKGQYYMDEKGVIKQYEGEKESEPKQKENDSPEYVTRKELFNEIKQLKKEIVDLLNS